MWWSLYLVLGETATEQAGTARLTILLLSQAAFQLVPQITQNNPYIGKNTPVLPPKMKRIHLV